MKVFLQLSRLSDSERSGTQQFAYNILLMRRIEMVMILAGILSVTQTSTLMSFLMMALLQFVETSSPICICMRPSRGFRKFAAE